MMFIYGSSPDQELFYSRVNPTEKQEDNQLEEAIGTSMAYTRTAQYVFLDSHTGLAIPTSEAISRDWLICTVQPEEALQPLGPSAVCQERTGISCCCSVCDGF